MRENIPQLRIMSVRYVAFHIAGVQQTAAIIMPAAINELHMGRPDGRSSVVFRIRRQESDFLSWGKSVTHDLKFLLVLQLYNRSHSEMHMLLPYALEVDSRVMML